jgi:hypothetical protein
VRHLAVLAVFCAVVAGCGGGSDQATKELRQTAEKLGSITSGTLTMRMVINPPSGTKGRVGFQLRGPFAFRKNALPVADITYTQYASTREASARFVSDGKTAYAVANGKRIALPASAVAQLRNATAGLGGNSGGGGLRIDTWLDHPSVSDGGEVGGADTDHVSADLDVVNAANGLLGLLRSLGRNAPTITGDSADQLRKSVKSSSIDVWTGKSDNLLRKLDLKAQLGLDVPQELRRAFGETVGAKFEFLLGITDPNKPVHVSP